MIKNYQQLAITPERKIVLDLIETALSSVQPTTAIQNNFKLVGNTLTIHDKTFDLSLYERIYLLGFGKGSAGISHIVEQTLGDRLTEGYVIDTVPAEFKKIQFTLGTHPLPSEQNYKFTSQIIEKLSNRSEKDLVLVVICGGGSAMLVHPTKLTLDEKISITKALLASGANIIEMNTVRKHLSSVKGGQLAKILYPATVASLIFSDVPGNDLSFIASGPTVKDTTSANDAVELLVRYKIGEKIEIKKEWLQETPKEDKYFERISNILMLSNLTALLAMTEKAKALKIESQIYSDRFQSDANEAGKKLIETTKPHSLLFVGGETTVVVKGHGKGGRNQQLVLASLPYIDQNTIIASVGTDGWDFDILAGAIGDSHTKQQAIEKNLDVQAYLNDNNSLAFFQAIGDGIETGRLPSNVSDLMIVYKT